MDLHTYAAAMCAAFLLAVVALGAVLIYLLDRHVLDRAATRRDRPAERPRDPYAQAQALAARRRAEHIGRARVPAAAGQGGTSWS